MKSIDFIYQQLLEEVRDAGDLITTRNAETYSNITLPNVTFYSAPLVTIRKTAWKKAIQEMEWFLSGNTKCPTKLLDWWNDQLNIDGHLLDAYPSQFRHYSEGIHNDTEYFDQIAFVFDALKSSPNSRRIITTVWHPGEMSRITETNDNTKTPTCCHSIIIQFFVRNNKLHMKTYQRSADMLLGVTHNWIQSWALLMYFAKHSGYEVGTMTWMWGDAHIYNEESHIACLNEILDCSPEHTSIQLVYEPHTVEYDSNNVPIFKASDFSIEGDIPEPLVTIRPKLL